MKTVKYEGYLTQQKLENLLADAFAGHISIFETEKKIDGLPNHRWDIYVEFLNGKKIAVEFDGDQHYRNMVTIDRDVMKDDSAYEQCIIPIRIPYWVQLTDETAKHYFGDLFDEIHIEQNYPHGFIKSKIFPASYCAMGVEMFLDDLFNLPHEVYDTVLDNMLDHGIGGKYDPHTVFPGAMADFLNDIFKDTEFTFENDKGTCFLVGEPD